MTDATSDLWTLTPLRGEDLPQVAAIETTVFPEPLGLAELSALFVDPRTTYVVFKKDDAVAAYFGFQVEGPTAHVIANATHPDYRRLRLGWRVLAEAEPIARARGARWFLGEVRTSNTPQRTLLRRLGWQEIGLCPRFFGNGEDAYVVWRLLPDPDRGGKA